MGCKVKIDGVPVLYEAKEEGESKKTVDLGAWLHAHQTGNFVEAKVAPTSFHEKDKMYLNILRQELQRHGEVSYTIFIFALDEEDLVKEKILACGYELQKDTILLGKTNIFSENILRVSV